MFRLNRSENRISKPSKITLPTRFSAGVASRSADGEDGGGYQNLVPKRFIPVMSVSNNGIILNV
jgi:hypothetical protein